MAEQRTYKPQELVYEPYETTEAFHADDTQVRGILGPIGSSKSSACCAELRFRAEQQEPDANGWRRTKWVVTRASYPSLVSTTIATWNQWMPQARVKMTPPMLWRWKQENAGTDADGNPDGTHIDMEVNFMSVSDLLEDINKIRSLNITGVWVNEAQEIEDVGIIKYLFSRCGRFPDPQSAQLTWSGLIMDANAMDLDHWWYKYAEEIRPRGWKFFRQPPALLKITDEKRIAEIKSGNPKAWRHGDKGIWIINPKCENVIGQPKHEQYWLDQVEGNHESWIRLNLCAEYGQSLDGKQVYIEFDEERHVAKKDLEAIPGLPLQLGFDFGLTPACAICQITPHGQLRVVDELCATDAGMRRFMTDAVKPMLASLYPGFAVSAIGEPAGNQRAQSDESTAMDEIRAAGVQCIPAPTNLFNARRDAVAGFMMKRVQSFATGKPVDEGFIVSPRCKMVLRGLRGEYKFKRVKVEGKDIYEAKAVKNEVSHIHDAVASIAVTYDRPKLDVQARNRMGNPDGKKFNIVNDPGYPAI